MNEVQVFKPESFKLDVTAWNAKAILAEKTAQRVTITDDTEEGMAVDSLSEIKTFQKEVETARKSEVEPFNKLLKTINDAFRPIADRLTSAEDAIKGKIRIYRMEKENIRRREEGRLRKEHDAAVAAEQKAAAEENRQAQIVLPPPAILPEAPTARGEIGKATSKTFWNYRVIDIGKLYAARPELVELKEKRRLVLEAVKDGKAIRGLELFEDMQIAAQ